MEEEEKKSFKNYHRIYKQPASQSIPLINDKFSPTHNVHNVHTGKYH